MPIAAPTGQVTLVFTDLQGSTELWERLGEGFGTVLNVHNAVMRGAIEACGGYEVKTEGDAFMVAFSRPDDAVRFALRVQLSMRDVVPDGLEQPLLVRIGMHTGEPICQSDPVTGRMDYFGPVVNRAARVGSAGHGGQVLVSRACHDAAAAALSGTAITDLGEHRLKGLERPERLYQVLPAELRDRAFAPIKTLTSVPTNLPFRPTSFIGREREWREIAAMFRDQSVPLLTLTGPGGIGKTRLALRVGSDLLDKFEGGVWIADLTEARSGEAVAAKVAAALGAPLVGKDKPQEAVASILEFRSPTLLILDNFEQVAAHAAGTVGLWMSRAPHVRFLITSRTLLGLEHEQEYELHPMAPPVLPRKGEAISPARLEALAADDAIRLFVERARDAKAGFALTAQNAGDIAGICAALDGIPLAIELAAARSAILQPAQLLQRLTQRFQLLRSNRRDVPARQQTLQGAMEWSFDLLTDYEKSAFCQACIFRGGFFLEAAERVIDLSQFPEAPLAMDVVQSLREKSLLVAAETPYETRFRMYVTVREFGLFKTDGALTPDQRTALDDRHADCCIEYAEQWDSRRAAEPIESLDRVEFEMENLFAVQERLQKRDPERAARAVLSLSTTMAVRGLTAERVPRLKQALAALDEHRPEAYSLRARLAVALCLACGDTGDWAEASAYADRAVQLSEQLGAGEQHASALLQKGELLRLRGELDPALAAFEEAERRFESLGDDAGRARAVGGKGTVWWQRGLFDQAIDAFQQATAAFDKIGNIAGMARNLSGRGIVLYERRDYAGALECYEQAESIARRLGNKAAIARSLNNRGLVLKDRGDLPEALACFTESEQINRELGQAASVARAIGNRGEVLEQMGDTEGALRGFAEAEATHRKIGNRQGQALNMGRRGALLLRVGRTEALAVLREACALFREQGASTRSALDCLAALAIAEAEAGDAEAARPIAREGLALAQRLKIEGEWPARQRLEALAG